jgi:hypothetical protein
MIVSRAIVQSRERANETALVEAVRVCSRGLLGPTALLMQAWSRLQLPLAITEAHLSGSAEDRARWFSYLWTGADAAVAAEVPVRAVTAWALLGSYGWDRLVTRGACSYEPPCEHELAAVDSHSSTELEGLSQSGNARQ